MLIINYVLNQVVGKALPFTHRTRIRSTEISMETVINKICQKHLTLITI
jgi:hypothetical protein